jgi:hypothetical protein
MIPLDQVVKIGEKYYLATDVQSVLDARIKALNPEEIDLE